MEIVIIQYIQCKNDRFPKAIYKTFESNVIPHKGDVIEDSVWKDHDGYEVAEVTIDYNYNRCEVKLNECKEEWNNFESFLKMAETHGWHERYPMKTR